MSGFPFGIEGRDPDIPSCWHSGTMRRSCCWSIPATIKLTRALVPAVAIDGKWAECCTGRGINVQVLRAAGLGAPLYSRANDWQTRRAYGFIFRGLFKISLCGFFITGRVFPDLH